MASTPYTQSKLMCTPGCVSSDASVSVLNATHLCFDGSHGRNVTAATLKVTGSASAAALSATGSLTIPSYATTDLPTSASKGMIAYDSTANKLKYYNGSAWALSSA